MKNKKVLEYRNPDSRCLYPFSSDLFKYCWGYACHVIEKKKGKYDCKECSYWKKEKK